MQKFFGEIDLSDFRLSAYFFVDLASRAWIFLIEFFFGKIDFPNIVS